MNWQPIVAGIAVALAALWLLRRMWRTVRRGLRGDASAACGSCPKNAAQRPDDAPRPVVQLDSKKREP